MHLEPEKTFLLSTNVSKSPEIHNRKPETQAFKHVSVFLMEIHHILEWWGRLLCLLLAVTEPAQCPSLFLKKKNQGRDEGKMLT